VSFGMLREVKQCQCCKKEFTLNEGDFALYAKLEVPHPTWCPECRMRRRLTFRNERTLYKRTCGMCKKSIIAMYDEAASYTIYCESCYNSDNWDRFSFGRDYDFNKNFFVQFNELLHAVPRIALEVLNNQNSPFTNYTWFSKNCYLAPSTLYSENVYYAKATDKTKDSIDVTECVECEWCYEILASEKCHSSSFLINCRECLNSAFLFDCVNCQDCILSYNLRNKRYCIRNVEYKKEDYEREKEKLVLSSRKALDALKKEFSQIMQTKAIHRFARLLKTVNTTGNNVSNARDSKNVFEMYNLENVRYAARGYNIKDSADMYGTDDTELDYECTNNGVLGSRIRYSTNTHSQVTNAEYTDYCRNSSNLFGCAGIKNGSYCIFNKQYSPEDYEKLRTKIIAHMNDMPYSDALHRIFRYGEFPPPELSPFAYNEAISAEYMLLEKEEAIALGYKWKDENKKTVSVTLKTEDIPDNSRYANEEILKEIIECAHKGECNEHCSLGFRLTPFELEFYKRLQLPIPDLCSNCRHYARLALKNPWKLYKRECDCGMQKSNIKNQNFGVPAEQIYKNITKHFHGSSPCTNEFETTYSPDRPEMIYCEKCYQQEVS